MALCSRRTSHEIASITELPEETMNAMIPWDAVKRHHDRALNPTHPHLRGTSQAPDIFMQMCEAANPYCASRNDLNNQVPGHF